MQPLTIIRLQFSCDTRFFNYLKHYENNYAPEVKTCDDGVHYIDLRTLETKVSQNILSRRLTASGLIDYCITGLSREIKKHVSDGIPPHHASLKALQDTIETLKEVKKETNLSLNGVNEFIKLAANSADEAIKAIIEYKKINPKAKESINIEDVCETLFSPLLKAEILREYKIDQEVIRLQFNEPYYPAKPFQDKLEQYIKRNYATDGYILCLDVAKLSKAPSILRDELSKIEQIEKEKMPKRVIESCIEDLEFQIQRCEADDGRKNDNGLRAMSEELKEGTTKLNEAKSIPITKDHLEKLREQTETLHQKTSQAIDNYKKEQQNQQYLQNVIGHCITDLRTEIKNHVSHGIPAHHASLKALQDTIETLEEVKKGTNLSLNGVNEFIKLAANSADKATINIEIESCIKDLEFQIQQCEADDGRKNDNGLRAMSEELKEGTTKLNEAKSIPITKDHLEKLREQTETLYKEASQAIDNYKKEQQNRNSFFSASYNKDDKPPVDVTFRKQ